MIESKKRRQAAWLCFEPYLKVEQRLLAIQMLEQGYQVEGMMNQINYIGAVCARFGINEKQRKSLNLSFYRLLSEMPASAIDPLPMLQKSLSGTVDSNRNMISGSSDQNSAESTSKLPPHTLVFCQLLYQVQDYCNKNELFEALKYVTRSGPKQEHVFSEMVECWAEKPDNFSWALQLNESELKQFVHLLYTGVCDALGPIEADRCFHAALAVCQRRKEAKEYPPTRFF